jgi:hypothetical protein
MTTISRRGFLGVFGAAAVGAVLDPERLLWVPGQKTIFLPSVGPAPSNTFRSAAMDGVVFRVENLHDSPLEIRMHKEWKVLIGHTQAPNSYHAQVMASHTVAAANQLAARIDAQILQDLARQIGVVTDVVG